MTKSKRPKIEIAPAPYVFWFRRDLRLHDNAGLAAALRSGRPVLPVFVFDRNILDRLEDRDDRRVEFIHRRVIELNEELRGMGSGLLALHGRPQEVLPRLAAERAIAGVFTNHDYEPYAIERDSEVAARLSERGLEFRSFKDQVIFERDEVIKDDGMPYTVFTPYKKKWRARLDADPSAARPIRRVGGAYFRFAPPPIPSLKSMGFRARGAPFPEAILPKARIEAYARSRDQMGAGGTSRIGLHLRFGTLSVRQAVTAALASSETWLSELVWREFFMQVLYHFPRVENEPFKAKYAGIRWRNDEEQFAAWCEGRTGVPIVDAGMRELNETGFMHNRARMIAASYLVKSLLIDWRWGEAYFARKLLDYELASNNGNWQWVAGTGCDAAPYFRVFNPALQARKFDPDGSYVRKWVPEAGTRGYPEPLIEPKTARIRALRVYREALSAGGSR